MAELCYKFTMVVSPDTELLCERLKAVRCELKLKELLQERQLWVFHFDLSLALFCTRKKKKWSLGADCLIAAGAYPGFCRMKQLRVFLLPLDGMLVHRRSLPCNLFGFLNNSPAPIYTTGWREALWESSVFPKNTTQCPRPGLEPRPFAPGTSAKAPIFPSGT